MALVKADIIAEAREITGNKSTEAAAGGGQHYIDDTAIDAGLKSSIRDLARRLGNSSTKKEAQFTAVVDQQDYSVATYVESGAKVIAVSRSAQYQPDDVLIDDQPSLYLDGRFNAADGGLIPAGLQNGSMRAIGQLQAFERFDSYGVDLSWPDKIRLIPPPTEAEIINVVYTVDTFDIEDLSEDCESALVYKCCVVILNGVLNRLSASPGVNATVGTVGDDRVKSLTQQRDYYERQYLAELAKLP